MRSAGPQPRPRRRRESNGPDISAPEEGVPNQALDTRSFESAIRDATIRTSDLTFSLAQVAAGTFSLASALLARGHVAPLASLALGLGGAGLLLFAWMTLGRLPDPGSGWRERASWRNAISARAGVIAFIAFAPISAAAVLHRYWPEGPLPAFAVAVLLGALTATAVVRLQASAHGLSSSQEEREGAAALGAVALGAALVVAWVLGRIAMAFTQGPLPGPASGGAGVLLSYASSVLAALGAATAFHLPKLARVPHTGVTRLSLCILCGPLVVVLLFPLQGKDVTGFLPQALDTLPSRVFLSALLAIALLHLFKPRLERP